jgi:hypothetical protein
VCESGCCRCSLGHLWVASVMVGLARWGWEGTWAFAASLGARFVLGASKASEALSPAGEHV